MKQDRISKEHQGTSIFYICNASICGLPGSAYILSMLAVTIAVPASVQVVNACWRRLGLVLRMNENVPARRAMTCYFNGKSHKSGQGNFCTIASVISDEYKDVFQKSIKNQVCT